MSTHWERVRKVNQEALRYINECDRMLGLLEPLKEDMDTSITNASDDFETVRPVICASEFIGSGDYFERYGESRDKWVEDYDNLSANATTTSSNLEQVISEIKAIKDEWEPKLYYYEWEEVEDNE